VTGRVRLLVVTDAHVACPATTPQRWHNEYAFAGSDQRLLEVLSSAGRRAADMAVVLGDLVNSPDQTELPSALVAPDVGELRFVCGNEDPPALRSTAPRDSVASVEGETLGTWLRLAGIHGVSDDGGATARVEDSPPGDLWGNDTLALLSHFPLLSRSSEFAANGMPYSGDLLDRSRWAEAILARSAPTVVLCGHLHARDAASAGRVLQLGFGALIEPPHEFSVVDFDPGNGYPRVRRRTLEMGHELPAHDPALASRTQEWAFDGDRWRLLEADSTHNDTAATFAMQQAIEN
jgi:Calcineurin-like phosphoesterase